MIAILVIFVILISSAIYLCWRHNSETFTTSGSASTDCTQTLTPCVNGECINCPDTFECVTVTDSENTNLIFNGGKVPIGQFCLPRKKGNKDCNRYTGRWVWTADGEQTWKCECLYPRLFGNDSTITNCTLKKACINPNHPDMDDPADPNIGNKLVGTKYAPTILQGETWDPIYHEKTEVLMVNPYTTDKDGNPYFSCQCNSNTADVKMSALPDSPYMCHVDRCWLNNNIKGIAAQPDGTVKCDCSEGGGQTVPEGTLAGTCFNVPLACGDGGTWDATKKMCICNETAGCSVKCGSRQYGLTGDKDVNGDEIMCETNQVGRMCYNMCSEKEPCQNGGTCNPICNEKAGGMVPDFSCKCIEDPKTKRKFSGKTCTDVCYTTGFVCSDKTCAGQACYCMEWENCNAVCCNPPTKLTDDCQLCK